MTSLHTSPPARRAAVLPILGLLLLGPPAAARQAAVDDPGTIRVAPRADGEGMAVIALSPGRLQFHNVLGDADASATVALTNTGKSSLAWSAEWLREPGAARTLRPQSGNLAPGGSVDIAVTATISANRERVWQELIQVSSPDAAKSPRSVELVFRVAAPGAVRLGISSPPVGNTERPSTQNWLEDLGVELIRTAVAWDRIEPVPGEYNWKKELEGKLRWAHDRDLSALLLVATKCPDWVVGARERAACAPDDMEQWRTYVRALVETLEALAAEYPNGLPIHRIMLGNEWHATRGYPGTAEQFTEQLNILYEEVKHAFPEMPVLPGGIGSSAIEDFVHGWRTEKRARVEYVLDHADYDAVSQHLYFDEVDWPAKIEALRTLALPPGRRDIEIVVGEFGGPDAIAEPRDDAYHAERVGAYIEALRQTDVAEAYYFTLVEQPEYQAGEPNLFAESGLVSKGTLSPKPGYYVFKANSWEVGAAPLARAPLGILDRRP